MQKTIRYRKLALVAHAYRKGAERGTVPVSPCGGRDSWRQCFRWDDTRPGRLLLFYDFPCGNQMSTGVIREHN